MAALGGYNELWRQNGAGHASVLAFRRGSGTCEHQAANTATSVGTVLSPLPKARDGLVPVHEVALRGVSLGGRGRVVHGELMF